MEFNKLLQPTKKKKQEKRDLNPCSLVLETNILTAELFSSNKNVL